MSYKGWLIVLVIFILLFYGSIFIIRMTPFFSESERACYDIETEGVPEFIHTHFIELEKIEYIKRFRSGCGVDASDDFEDCRIMNNGFVPFEEYLGDKEVKIYSPVNGTIIKIGHTFLNESGSWNEFQSDKATTIKIQPSEYPAFTIILSFVDIRDTGLYIGLQVSAGQHIGYACLEYQSAFSKISLFSITVKVNTCQSITKRVSYFDVITDNIFQAYKDRGATAREEFIISKEERDKDPLTCVLNPNAGCYWIRDKGNIPNWVYLGDNPDDFQIVHDYS